MTADQIEQARKRQQRVGLKATADPVVLRRVAVLLAVRRQRRKERDDHEPQ